MRLHDRDDPLQPTLDDQPEGVPLDDLVALLRAIGEGELHLVAAAEDADRRVGGEALGGLVRAPEDLDRARGQLDHRVSSVP